MGSHLHLLLRYMDDKILKCYEIVKLFLKCFEFKIILLFHNILVFYYPCILIEKCEWDPMQ